ncbi:RING-H2 finger protein ATL64-like [Cucumis melo var. makuwa]|uniref:RING-H2 finger protein ATL64-like n=1 Tax=Cucumis melo var. makuwa TaxID=1194695 RepID=A0A5A7VJ04_CUCMM|nr:RING-H2 finger protein ATL64-like [Cucumis melo var. makuwa]
MSSPILLPPLLPLPPSPLHSPIVLPRSIEDLLMLSMFILLVIAILCGKRSAKSDEEESLLENLDIQALIFHYGVDGDDEQECAICLYKIEE